MSKKISKLSVVSNLFDLYKNLLTDKQQLIFSKYFFEDFSLSEIAKEMKISRQAVTNAIAVTEETLKDIEKKVGFLKYKKDLKLFLNKAIKLENFEDIKKELE